MRTMIPIAHQRPGAPRAGAPPAATLARIRWGVLSLAGAAGLGLAASAGAADIPSSTKSTVALFSANNSLATRQHAFETAKDSDWFRVRLKGGVDYYVTGLYGDQGDNSVLQSTFRDAAGNILVQALFFDPFTADGRHLLHRVAHHQQRGREGLRGPARRRLPEGDHHQVHDATRSGARQQCPGRCS
jgi:hypothetical protein